MAKNNLSALIGSRNARVFFDERWPQSPLFIPSLGGAANELLKHPSLQSLEALSQLGPFLAVASLPDFSDEYSSLHIPAEEIGKAFRNKLPIAFNPNIPTTPELQKWLPGISDELGFTAGAVPRIIVYATPKGAGTSCHYDHSFNFVLQITGSKVWSMAPNENCVNPDMRYTVNSPVDPVTAGYSRLPMPKAIPRKGKKTVTLRPGSFLFMPRGYWHETKAEEDSISLTFTFTPRTWAQLVSESLQSLLSKDERWRGSARGFLSKNKKSREAAALELDALLDSPDDIARLISKLRFASLERIHAHRAKKKLGSA